MASSRQYAARELVASIFNRFDRPDRHNRRYLPYAVGGLVLLFFAGSMFLFLRLEQRSALTSEFEFADPNFPTRLRDRLHRTGERFG